LDAGNDATLNATVTAGQNVVGTADNNLTTMQAVTATAGSASLGAGNDANLNGTILAGQNVTGAAGQNLTTMQTVTATAGSVMLDAGSNATIGAPVNALGGGGQIVAEAGGNLGVNGQLSANDDITGMAGVNISTSQVIDSTTGTVTLDAGNVVSLGADVNAKGPAGEIVLATAQNDRAALQLGAGVELDTTNGSDGGRISAATFQLLGTRFTLLDTSVDLTFPPLTLGANLATVRIIATDAAGIRFRVEVDWMESNAGPDGERFDVIVIDGNSITDVTHRYVDNPTGDAAADIPILVRIIALGPDDSIRAFIGDGAGGTVSVLDHFDATSEQTGISTEILIDVQDIPSVVITFPAPEELPSTPEAPPTIFVSFEFESQPVERGNTTFIESSTGGVVRGENRYYQLRIVSFDEDGNLVETPKGESINLNDDRLKAIAPFDPSKLPALFGRLPADRYRIYLIEDDTERLILDFIIQQGQPIEVPETFEGDVEGPAGTIEGNGALRELLEADQLVQPGTGDFGWALPGPATHLQAAESFAERFGNASFISHGGMMVGAAALAAASSGRWEKSMDRVMEQFGRRRPFTRGRKVTRQLNGAGDHAPRTSLSLKD
ncbi:MAG TPA: hypothetical protein VJ828_03585, partial [Lacipirellulaceae bacterium]|nr:hypothetical protein [Lacipirellulaceae bacterium]